MSDRSKSRRIPALDTLRGDHERVRGDTSDARLYVRDNYRSIAAARSRGASWPQITETLAAAGVQAPDGGPLHWRKTAILFHTEKRLLEERKKRKGRTKAATRSPLGPLVIAPEEPAPADPGPAPPEPPQPASSPPATAPVPAKPTNRLAEVTRPKEGLPVVPLLRISETGRD